MATTKVTTPVTDFDKLNTEEGLKIPSGTSSNQPTGVEGMIRNDTTQSSKGSTSAISFYNGTNWKYFENELNTSFNTVIYTGNASTTPITGVGFQPDLVWVKNRTSTSGYYHGIFDSIRGANKVISSNNTDTENRYGNWTQQLTSFDSDGFSLGNNSDGGNYVNLSGSNYVAWCFKAGGAPSGSDKVSIDGTSYATMADAGLTDGTEAIDKLSVNTTLGFSIVKYTAPALIANTVAHGLGETPEMIILKSTNVLRNWNVFHEGVGTSKNLHLNTTDAASTGEYWTANSSTFSIQDYSASADWIAYCFTSKTNYSKLGTYVGSGSAGNNKIDTGFEPAFIMVKRVSPAGAGWYIVDNKRDTNTNKNKYLSANTADAEYTSGSSVTFNTDGFTFNGSSYNTSGADHIYLAFANTI